MLHLALEKSYEVSLVKVLIGCSVESVGSNKVIENNDGIYENNYYDKTLGKTFKRFWINVENQLKTNEFSKKNNK